MDYIIGDIQGCFSSLQQLLAKVNFVDGDDKLWLVGDLVNRGPQSVSVLSFLKDLKTPPNIVLGNHDLHLLAVYFGQKKYRKKKDSFIDVLESDRADELCQWLLAQKMMIHCEQHNVVMTHAGIWPHWSLEEALVHAQHVEKTMQSSPQTFFNSMYGNMPDSFHPDLPDSDIVRFTVNSLTRMRYCFADARLELEHKGKKAPAGLYPWFTLPTRKILPATLFFGHWASLNAEVDVPNVVGLDTGCIWGGCLTAYCIQTKEKISVSC